MNDICIVVESWDLDVGGSSWLINCTLLCVATSQQHVIIEEPNLALASNLILREI